MNLHPFSEISHRLSLLGNNLRETESTARQRLPGVPWDFSALESLLTNMSELLGAGRALAAWQAYNSFSVPTPGSLLGKITSPRKQAAARLIGWKGGKQKSERKRLACALNLEKARRAKAIRRNERVLRAERDEIQKLNRRRCALDCSASAAFDPERKKALQNQVAELESRILELAKVNKLPLKYAWVRRQLR